MLSITAQGITLGASNGPAPSDLLVLETITVTAASLVLLTLAATYYQSHYTQASSIAIPYPGVSNYQVAKNKADALDLIEAAVAVLATREAGVQILYRGTTFDQAVIEQC